MYCYVWEFDVRPEKLGDFEAAYGEDGDWVRLFRRDPGYIRTLLLRDAERSERFVTIDFWTSREVCLSFRERFRAELQELDAGFEAWTRRETHVGDFGVVR